MTSRIRKFGLILNCLVVLKLIEISVSFDLHYLMILILIVIPTSLSSLNSEIISSKTLSLTTTVLSFAYNKVENMMLSRQADKWEGRHAREK